METSIPTIEEKADMVITFMSEVFSEFSSADLSAQTCERWFERFTCAANSMHAGAALALQSVRDYNAFAVAHYTNAAAYGAHKAGATYGEANKILEMQDALADFPQLQQEFRMGLLSQEQVRLILEGTILDPDVLNELIEIAHRDTLARLLERVRRIKASKNPQPEEGAKTRARLRFRSNGAFFNQLLGNFSNEQRALIEAKLEPETDRVFREMSRAGTFETRDNCRALALINLICGAGNGKAPRAHFLITVDLAAVQRGEKTLDEVCNIPGVGPVEKGILFRLLSDAYVDLDIQTDNHLTVPLEQRAPKSHAGHRSSPGYKIAEEIRRKLRGNGGHVCAMRGCDIVVGLDCDHNHEWRDGGITCECNLEFLCRRHHGMKTKERLMLVGPRNSRVFVNQRSPPSRGVP